MVASDDDIIVALRRTRSIISRGWTQATLARTRLGDPISALHADAMYFCIMGGVYRATGGENDLYRAVKYALITALPRGFDSVEGYNDAQGRSVGEMLTLIERAIKVVERQEHRPIPLPPLEKDGPLMKRVLEAFRRRQSEQAATDPHEQQLVA